MRRIFDGHLHLRDKTLLEIILAISTRYTKYAVIMPNLLPPDTILSGVEAKAYKQRILDCAKKLNLSHLPNLLMTISVDERITTERDIVLASQHDVRALKVYPRDLTHNSGYGVSDYKKIIPILKKAEELGMKVLFHPEHPGKIDCIHRSVRFLDIAKMVLDHCPNLQICLEHISSFQEVDFVMASPPNVAATVTVQHLFLTLNDIVGSRLHPHNYCVSVPKLYKDQARLIEAVLSGYPQIMYGSDSAAHMREAKECSDGCPGVFSAPVMIPMLAVLFNQFGKLDLLQDFTSTFAANWWGIPLWDETIAIVEEPWTVPAEYGGVVPWQANETIPLSVAG
jgi:dihydroorotase